MFSSLLEQLNLPEENAKAYGPMYLRREMIVHFIQNKEVLYPFVNTTHKSGNLLDLILSEISKKVNIKTVNPGPYVSDHQATIAMINVP